MTKKQKELIGKIRTGMDEVENVLLHGKYGKRGLLPETPSRTEAEIAGDDFFDHADGRTYPGPDDWRNTRPQ